MRKIKKNINTKGIYIKNVNYDTTIEDFDIFLTRYLNNYNNIYFLKNNLNNFIGRIVITFDNIEIAKNAIFKLHNIKFKNKKLKVNYAYPKYLIEDYDIVEKFNLIL
jgi:RNA recognition motif-containing protein